MANQEHLAILRQGVEVWNEWRKANPVVKPDLSGANFRGTMLEGVSFIGVNLSDANLEGANINGANLLFADLYNANLSSANLRHTNLSDGFFMLANFTGTDLSHADLGDADLGYADLKDAFLESANLRQVKALATNFEGATLTGACIQDWHINADTNFNDVTCDYVYLKWDGEKNEFQERRPHTGIFAPGEFTALFQKALETVDLIFADGIDWKAFFQSFQELQTQYANEELSIQAIEKKPGGAFVIRLETPAADVDKAAIEAAAMEKYQAQLQLLESQYRTQLHAKDEQIEIYRHQNTSLIEVVRSMASRPVIITNTNTLEATAMSNSQSAGDTYHGTIKATNFAPRGTASGGTFNDYSQTITNNLDEIGQLINTLRSQAEQFPPAARNEVLEHLNDLQADLQHPEQVKPSRLKATFAALLAIAVGIATATDFANNVLELGNKFDIELVQPQSPQSYPFPQSPQPPGTPAVDVKRLEGGSR